MSQGLHSAEQADQLKADALAHYPAMCALLKQGYGKSISQAKEDHDLIAIMGSAADIIRDLEEIAELAKREAAALRGRLALAMEASGATGVATGTHSVSWHEGRNTVDILDTAAVPPEFMVQPPPHPDKKAIAKYLAKHTPNWARFVRGAPYLEFRKTET